MAKYKTAEIPKTMNRRTVNSFYAEMWDRVREAAKKKKAIVVEVPDGKEVAEFANNVRQNAYHRMGRGAVCVNRLLGKRQILIWMRPKS